MRVLTARKHSSDTIKRNHRPHYNLAVTFLRGGLITMFSDVMESGWPVSTGSPVHLIIASFEVRDKIDILAIPGQNGLFNEASLYLVISVCDRRKKGGDGRQSRR